MGWNYIHSQTSPLKFRNEYIYVISSHMDVITHVTHVGIKVNTRLLTWINFNPSMDKHWAPNHQVWFCDVLVVIN